MLVASFVVSVPPHTENLKNHSTAMEIVANTLVLSTQTTKSMKNLCHKKAEHFPYGKTANGLNQRSGFGIHSHT